MSGEGAQRNGRPALPTALRWPGAGALAGMMTFLAVTAVAAAWGHWSMWAALAAGFGAQAALAVVVQARPRAVPAVLAEVVARLEEADLHRARLHPLTCAEASPHVHVRGPLGKLTVTLEAETTGSEENA